MKIGRGGALHGIVFERSTTRRAARDMRRRRYETVFPLGGVDVRLGSEWGQFPGRILRIENATKERGVDVGSSSMSQRSEVLSVVSERRVPAIPHLPTSRRSR